MSEQELQFYYFKLHDYNNDNKLDGLELTKAITHFHAGELVEPVLCKYMNVILRFWYNPF